jgi:hypothetical protein
MWSCGTEAQEVELRCWRSYEREELRWDAATHKESSDGGSSVLAVEEKKK